MEEAAKHGEIVVLATPGAVAEDVLRNARTGNFAGKVIIDVTNPLDFSKGPGPALFVGVTDSLGERTQRLLPDAKVVKGFNTVSNAQMVGPEVRGRGPRDADLRERCRSEAESRRDPEGSSEGPG